MKRIFFVLFCLLWSVTAYSQQRYFELTPKGFVSAWDKSGAIEFDLPGESRGGLYKLALATLEEMFSASESTLSKVEGQKITINGVGKDAVEMDGRKFDLNYTMVCELFDGKVKLHSPVVKRIRASSGGSEEIHVGESSGISIFNDRGETGLGSVKQALERYVNGMVSEAMAIAGDKWYDM